jgi:hypothetical protein
VRRSEVSFLCSIHRDSCATEAKAVSASRAGKGPGSVWVRMNRSLCGPGFWPGSEHSYRDQGATAGPNPTLRGPVRRS